MDDCRHAGFDRDYINRRVRQQRRIWRATWHEPIWRMPHPTAMREHRLGSN